MKTGLFGGTFDPVHNGHIKVAQAAKSHLQLDRVIFIPSGDPPHKTGRSITDKADRLAMVRLAAKEADALVSEWELNREEKSYSLETVRHFQKEFPEDELYFIIGADSFHDLPAWWHYRELLTACRFAVVSRPEIEEARLLEWYKGDEAPPRVFFLDNLFIDISSTRIRQLAGEGKDISQLVPPSVLAYIQEQKLYESN